MPRREDVSIDLSGVVVHRARDRAEVDLGGLRGVQVAVLMRHRH